MGWIAVLSQRSLIHSDSDPLKNRIIRPLPVRVTTEGPSPYVLLKGDMFIPKKYHSINGDGLKSLIRKRCCWVGIVNERSVTIQKYLYLWWTHLSISFLVA